MPTASSLAWKTSLRKVRTLWHCSRLRSVRYSMIDRGDIRQAIDRCSNIWASLPGAAGYGQFWRRRWQPDCKIEEAGGTVREIDGADRVTAIISASTLHHRLPVALLIITVITPLPTKPSATKMPENQLRTRQLPTCRCVSVMLLRRCKIHEGVSWC